MKRSFRGCTALNLASWTFENYCLDSTVTSKNNPEVKENQSENQNGEQIPHTKIEITRKIVRAMISRFSAKSLYQIQITLADIFELSLRPLLHQNDTILR